MITIEDILRPVSEELPCGKDLYDTGELFELESLAALRPATNDEGKRIAKDMDTTRDPEWTKLAARCEEMLRKSRDLRIAGYYTAALLRTNGFSGFALGVEITLKMLEKWGMAAHPVTEPRSGDSVRERLGAIVGISAPYKREGDLLRVIEGIRAIPLAVVANDTYAYAQILESRQADGTNDTAVVGGIRDYWRKADGAKKAGFFDSIRTSIKNLEAIESWIQTQLPSEHVPSDPTMSSVLPLADELKAIMRVLDADSGKEFAQKTPAVGKDAKMNDNTPDDSHNAPPPGVPGEIRSREDAVRLLGQVRDYFQRTEPTCPANFFIERAMKLVGKNFLEALNELMPDTAAKFEELTGLSLNGEKKDGN